MFNKLKRILKNQKGQGVWEYMVILIGIGVVAGSVTLALKTGLIGDNGTVDKVTTKIGDIIDQTATGN